MLPIATSLLALALLASAAPRLERRQSIPKVASSTITSYRPFTHYASTAYCNPSTTINWSCGANCAANPSFKPIAAGGDGDSTQFWYVGYDPTLNTIIVAHQGTDDTQFFADLTDADFFLESLSPSLFPGLSSSIEVHNGFQSEQASTAPLILSAVQTGLSRYSTKSVTLVGHSLGAALSLLDSHNDVQNCRVWSPESRNPAFANYVDAHQHLTHINNMKDPIPIVPGRFLGFAHPSGENHINADLSWSACPGQDNTSNLCTVGDVPNIFDGDLSNHGGPYDGITMGC